jgi:hypothetical protein
LSKYIRYAEIGIIPSLSEVPMAEQLVNPASAAQLQPRNQEPTHLGGLSWDDLGGTTTNSAPNTATINAAGGVKGQDTSIPRSVPAEPSHLTGMATEEDDTPEVEVEFGDEKDEETDVDDLDKALDEFDDLPMSDVEVKNDEDDEKKDMSEEAEDDEDDEKDITEEAEDDEKKDMSEEAEDDEKDITEEAEDDEKKDMSEEDEDEKDLTEEEDEGEKVDEDEDKGDEKVVAESLKVRIKMPKSSLFESAGFNAKQQKKVAAVFESAIKQTTKQVGAQIHEHYRRVHRRKLSEAKTKLESRLNDYLQVVVEEWFNANRVAVRQSLRADLAENFLNGLQTLFKEHYIDVPESKVDVVKTLTAEVQSLRAQVNEQVTQKMKLRKLAEAANKKRIVAEFARTLSESQSAKLEKLAEDTAYVSAKDFREKLTMLKESYFGESRPSRVTRLPEENVQVVKETHGAKSEVDVVADAISRQVKSNW